MRRKFSGAGAVALSTVALTLACSGESDIGGYVNEVTGSGGFFNYGSGGAQLPSTGGFSTATGGFYNPSTGGLTGAGGIPVGNGGVFGTSGGAAGAFGNGGDAGATGTGGGAGAASTGGSTGTDGGAGTPGTGGLGPDGSVGNGGAGGATGSGGTGGVGGGGDGGALFTGGAANTGGVANTGGTVNTGGTAGTGGNGGSTGTCCSNGDCICRDPPPSSLSAAPGPYATTSYALAGAGCVFYPTSGQAPFSAVAISDGFLGAGGCIGAQTSGWGPLLASHGIVTMIIDTLGGDQPAQRATKLLAGIAAFKTENTKSGSPLFGKLAGRYGTSGFSMGGGGTTRATVQDHTLLSSVAIMPYSPQGTGVVTPTLIICGSSDTIAPCASHGTPVYGQIPDTTDKMRVTINSSHSGQPSSGGNMSGAWGLAFHKTFLDGDERWRPLLVAGNPTATNIQ